jgi:hypothetical protein
MGCCVVRQPLAVKKTKSISIDCCQAAPRCQENEGLKVRMNFLTRVRIPGAVFDANAMHFADSRNFVGEN